jgi:AraC-like DNA-binding protein
LLNEFPRSYVQLVLRVKADVLRRKLTALTGVAHARKIEFAPVTRGKDLNNLRRLIRFLTRELDLHNSNLPPLMLAELEQAVVVAFLCSTPSNVTPLLSGKPQAPASWQVRRAEEYIRANWKEPLSVEKIASYSGASVRSIFYHFQRNRGQSPMAFLRDVRLQNAREMLIRPHADISVTQVAFECGFSNPGHFARRYFERYQERPSDTVRRNRA